METFIVTMPAGKYWLGDPCYSFPDSMEWQQVLNKATHCIHSPLVEHQGAKILAVPTRFGDGECHARHEVDDYEMPLVVTSGFMGLVPEEFTGGIQPAFTGWFRVDRDFPVEYVGNAINVNGWMIDLNK